MVLDSLAEKYHVTSDAIAYAWLFGFYVTKQKCKLSSEPQILIELKMLPKLLR